MQVSERGRKDFAALVLSGMWEFVVAGVERELQEDAVKLSEKKALVEVWVKIWESTAVVVGGEMWDEVLVLVKRRVWESVLLRRERVVWEAALLVEMSWRGEHNDHYQLQMVHRWSQK